MPLINSLINVPSNDLFLATVIVCLPDVGHAIVLPDSVSVIMDAHPIVVTLPFTDCTFGTSTYAMYPAGATVVCAKSRSGSSYIAYIVGAIDKSLDTRMHIVKAMKPYNADDWTQSAKDALSQWKLLEKLCKSGEHTYVRTRSHGVSSDALPGDYDISDKTGLNGIHIGRMLSQLRGSAMAFVDVDMMDNSVRLVGDKISEHTLFTESETAPGYSVKNTAISLSEAFGLRSGAIATEDATNEEITLNEETALPFYRIQHMEGTVIDGSEDIVLALPDNVDVHDSNNEPHVLSKVRRGLDGSLLNASALNLTSVKSPAIFAIMQAKYGSKTDDLRIPCEEDEATKQQESIKLQNQIEKQTGSKDNDRNIDDAALNKLIDTLLEGDYKQALLDILADKGFSRSNKEASIYGVIKDTTPSGGVTTKMEYALPDSIQLTDPITKETKTYYASMSFISQEPDGSICLCDGYGSEIRMSRGNIYISPALDCIVRTGRDMSVMAGRYQAYNSQQTCTINSSTSMYLRSIKDMQIVGATGKKGKMIIECKNETKDDKSGLIIKSWESLSLTAKNDLYIGKSRYEFKNEHGVDIDNSGTLILDAGSAGSVYMRGKEIMGDAKQFIFCANDVSIDSTDFVPLSDEDLATWNEIEQKEEDERTDEEKELIKKRQQELKERPGAAFVLTGELSSLFTKQFEISGAVSIRERHKAAALIRKGTTKTVALSTVEKPSLFVEGSTTLNSSLSVAGTISPKHINMAGTVPHHGTNVSFTFSNVSSKDPQRDESGIQTQTLKDIPEAQNGVYQDISTTQNTFSFPESYNTDVSATIPGMVWQDVAKNAKNPGKYWRETHINKTACYPGYNAWRSQLISVRGYETPLSVLTGYIVNADLPEDAIPAAETLIKPEKSGD